MPRIQLLVAFVAFAIANALAEPPPPPAGETQPLFDGRTLSGWEGNTNLWRVEGGAITGGSLTQTVKQNDFLATTRAFTNFIVRMKIKLTGTEGFINSGFQIRSQRVPKSPEMAGYQCDFGDPNWWGAIYDEARRNKVMSPSDMQALGPVIRRQDWNDYVIRADGPRVTTWINGVQGTDYFESDPAIPDWGRHGIQVHGGGKALVQVKEISIEELPATPPGRRFLGAPEPKKTSKIEPLSPAEERAHFTLPPGFEIELVASEADGIGKFVAIDWDTQGRLWTMTALEYPVDANENPGAAKELYASKAKDKVLVFDRDPQSPTGYSTRPRVFAEGLAIPLGILPYRNGVYVQHGPDIVFLSDNDGDGRSDRREVILSGFGVQDSHLFPHQFTRAPGNWIWMAQGAFNYGKVRTSQGAEVQFDQTRMARFRYDGSEFDITSQGPCNIWGLAMTMEGETWIQEANDYGYPAMPFHEYANYPGCSDAQMKSYAPEFPGTAPDFKMGGTGLSGLAFSDRAAWPEAYADVLYVANPITRKIQAIKPHRDGPRYRLQKLPDLVQSSDEMFRPVALRTGPDGCLYIVDWYNKIISHNEVPRNHPERDKKRGRIWRVKHRSQTPFAVQDFTKLRWEELVVYLGGDSLTQSHLAWQAIVDRQLTNLAPALRAIVADASLPARRRIASLWALEGLEPPDVALLQLLLGDANRNVRRQSVRALAAIRPGQAQTWRAHFAFLEAAANDGDPEVRAEVIKTAAMTMRRLEAAGNAESDDLIQQRALPLLISLAKEPLATPTARSTHNGRTIKVREAYEREFERYLVRLFLERHSEAVATFLDSDRSRSLPAESRMVATLALEPNLSAARVAALLPALDRPPASEEALRLAQFPAEPGVADALKAALNNPATQTATLESLLAVRTRFDPARIAPILTAAAESLWTRNDAARDLALRIVSAFKLRSFEAQLVTTARDASAPLKSRTDALRALRDLNSSEAEAIAAIARTASSLRDDALGALAASRHERAPALLLDLWPELNFMQRRAALGSLSSSRAGASAIVKAAKAGTLAHSDLDPTTLDRLQAVLGTNAELASLLSELGHVLRPAVRFGGKPDTYVPTRITLEGPFTVECWLKLDPGINNQDGILGAPGQLDMNFHDARFRVWVAGHNDLVVAKRKTSPDIWTHYAVTRDAQGLFRIFINGEADSASSVAATNQFVGLDVGRTIPRNGGMAGWMTEFRVWNHARSGPQIREHFDRSFASPGEIKAGPQTTQGLTKLYTASDWPPFHGDARVQKTMDIPVLLTAAEARIQAEKFERFRSLAEKPGNRRQGQALFASLCLSCHSAAGQGGQVGPVLSGAGAMGTDSLLRNLLTPNAAMEAGFRIFRVELADGDIIDGILVSQDASAIVLRRPNVDDTRVATRDVRRAGFINRSMMPEGLLDPLKPEEVTDLFAYLKSLK